MSDKKNGHHRGTKSEYVFFAVACLVVLTCLSINQAEADSRSTKGYWNSPYVWANDISGVHMVLMKGQTGYHSQVMYLYGGGVGVPNPPQLFRFNPNDTLAVATPFAINPAIQAMPVDINLFCSAHSALPDGRILFSGGTEGGAGEGLGESGVRIFNPNPPGWAVGPKMEYGRWYPTNTTLPDGRILVTSGRRFREVFMYGGTDETGSAKAGLSAHFGVRADFETQTSATIGQRPGARSGHTAIFDEANKASVRTSYYPQQRMVMFGGRNDIGALVDSTHALKRTEAGILSWEALTPTGTPPAARADHSAAYSDPAKMFVFGGRSSSGLLKDLWKLQLRTTSGGTDAWSQIATGTETSGLDGREGSSLLWWHQATQVTGQEWLYLFGGLGTDYHNDVWRLQIAPFQGTAWQLVTTQGSPPPKRAWQVAVIEEDLSGYSTGMLVFGGENATGTVPRDLYRLTLPISGMPTWSRIYPDSTPAPMQRTRASGFYDREFRQLVILGGDATPGSPGGEYDDIWKTTVGSSPKWRADPLSLNGKRAGASAIYDSRWVDSEDSEIYDAKTNQWTTQEEARLFQPLYPHMFVVPGGKVYSAAEESTFVLDTSALSPTWSAPSGYAASPMHGGSSVVYQPGKIMKCGSESGAGTTGTAWIDLNLPEPEWDHDLSSFTDPRVKHNLVLMPNGTVMMMGGMRQSFKLGSATRAPRIWDPWQSPPVWQADSLAQDPAIRDYHSTALLLPDGRVMTAGGWTSSDRKAASIFWPPYLFQASGALATRPVISCVPEQIGYGGEFRIESPDAANIDLTRVALLKPSAVTHQFNQDQRYVPCSATRVGLTNGILIDCPEDSVIAPPGDYMLFLLNTSGVPSIASWVRISSGTHEVSGTLPAGTTNWSGKYHVTGTLTVSAGATLTIQPGSGMPQVSRTPG